VSSLRTPRSKNVTPFRRIDRVIRFAGLVSFAGVLASSCAVSPVRTSGLYTAASQEGPSQTAYIPPNGRGPVAVVLSGATGPRLYDPFAAALAKEGYYVVLLDGNEVRRNAAGEASLRRAIERAQKAPNAIPGRVGVVGFSLGGGMALWRAADMPELVSVVVVYYPSTSFVSDARDLVRRFRVPVLMLAGEQDRYNDCCLIETARAIEAAAKDRKVSFTLVSYPNAEHGFNLAVPAYRAQDDADAWKRTLEALRQYVRPMQ
jgi:dienelactone hydrolase